MQQIMALRHQSNSSSWWLDISFLTLALGILYFAFLGHRPLFVPDEGRYAEIIREMVTSNDFITPHLNGIKYFEKPILFYWLGSLVAKTFSLSIASLRSINAFLGWSGCMILYFTGRMIYDRQTGLLAAFIAGTSLLYFAMAHIINLDMTVSFFLTASLCFFLLGTHTNTKGYFWLAATGAALAVLTKGLIGIVFPILIIGSWTLLLNKWHNLKNWYIPSSLILFLAITIPWHYAVQQQNPEFFYLYFIEQHFLRFTDANIGHYSPAWYFIPCLFLGFFPWIVFLPQTIKSSLPTSWRLRGEKQNELFLMLWAVLIFAFFSASKSKLISYILPVLPPLALLTANYLKKVTVSKVTTQISWFALILFATTLGVSLFFFLENSPMPNPIVAKQGLSFAALLLMGGILLSGAIGFRKNHLAIVLTIATLWIFLQLATLCVPAIDTRTILPLAQTLKPMLKEKDEVITYNQYFQDLPFYLERRITILNWQNELARGMQHQDTKEWMINDREFWQRWHSDHRVFVLMSRDEFEQFKTKPFHVKPQIIGKTINNILIVNKI